MSGINQRIEKLIQILDYNKNSFCRKLGYSYNATIENIVGKRQSKPGYEFLHSVLTTFPQVNPRWLMTGEGDVLIDQKKENALLAVKNRKVTQAPIISQFAFAGYLRGFCDAEFLESQPVYYSARKYQSGNYIAFEIRGESMQDKTERSICDGDILLCREISNETVKEGLPINKIYVIVSREEGITCKEITGHNKEMGEITCHSWNSLPDYVDFILNLKDVAQIFTLIEISRMVKC